MKRYFSIFALLLISLIAGSGPALAVSDNTSFGTSALSSLTTGTGDSAFGFEAQQQCTSGMENTAVGTVALQKKHDRQKQHRSRFRGPSEPRWGKRKYRAGVGGDGSRGDRQ